MIKRYIIEQLVTCNIRLKPSLYSNKTGTYALKGSKWSSNEMKPDGDRCWYKHSKGWVSSGTNFTCMKVIDNSIKSQIVDEELSLPNDLSENEDLSLNINNLDYKIENLNIGINHDWLTKSTLIQGINGLPSQFLSSTDVRLSEYTTDNLKISSKYGKIYSRKILERMPLLMLSPGKPIFLEGKSKDTKKGVLNAFAKNNNLTQNQLSDLLNGLNGRIYSFQFDYVGYYKKVNMLARSVAEYLGIGDMKYNGISLKNYDWGESSKNSYKKFFTSLEVVPYYVEGEVSVSDSMSNSSKESSLSSASKGVTDMARELNFYMGTAGLSMGDKNNEEIASNTKRLQKSISENLNFLPKTLVNRLTESSSTILSGGKLDYPEIFNDSSYSKDNYSVRMKFIAPYGTTLSIYLYIMLPLIKLLPMVIPMQLTENSYSKPYLVRGFLKSVFSVDLGLITSLSFTKGQECGWNIDHLPTQLDVELSIKDLYSGLFLPNNMNQFLNNTLMMDFIANLCGIDIAKCEIDRKLNLWLTDKYNLINDIPRNTSRNFEQSLSNMMNQWLGR